MKTPLYKDLKFSSEELFNKWLDETTKYKIDLIDRGQDVLTFWVAKNKEIIHCSPFQTSIWNGTFIDTKNLKSRYNMVMYIEGKWRTMDFIINRVTIY